MPVCFEELFRVRAVQNMPPNEASFGYEGPATLEDGRIVIPFREVVRVVNVT